MITDEMLLALLETRITFTKFANDVRVDLVKLSGSIVAKYKGQITTVGVEDLIQIMLMSIHRHLPIYDSKKGSIRTYITTRMYWDAGHEIRHAAALNKTDDRSLYATWMLSQEPGYCPVQEEYCLARDLREKLSTDDRSRVILDSLSRTCSLDKTVSELLANPDASSMFSSHPERVKRGVYRSARRLAERAKSIA